MKKLKIIVTLACFTMGLSGFAQADSYYDYAKVKRVTPVYKYVKVGGPIEQCYTVKRHRHRDAGPAILGAIVGGAVGNAIGENTASTLAGAFIGSSISHSASHSRSYLTEHCEVEYRPTRKVRKLKGYDVTYRYKGNAYQTFLKRHPGDKIKVRVKVSPAYYD